MLLRKIKMTPREKKELELAQLDIEKQNAKTDYIAMMTDVDIPEEGEIENEQEV